MEITINNVKDLRKDKNLAKPKPKVSREIIRAHSLLSFEIIKKILVDYF